jgi:hypothetical protein
MQLPLVTCSKCKAILPTDRFNAEGLAPCPSCAQPIAAYVFPALFREHAVTEGERLVLEGEASCFYHPQKKAVLPCESCGRFLCALCDVELNGAHLCSGCLDSGQKKGKLKSLENRRVLYDRIALIAAILPVLFIWTSIIGAPIALYVAIRYWKEPCSILGRSRARFIWAIILSSLQIIGWISIIVYFATK